ncbi:MAG: TrkA family potassium uptake protein [Chloroflexota bacterium]
MRTIVVGCGRVGAGIASRLTEEGHEVTILDTRTEAFRRLDPEFPGQALRGDGTDQSVLRRAGADGADWFFALTNGDNRNVLAAQLAHDTFGIPRVLAKINDPVRARAYAALGIDTINRTDMMVGAIERYMGKAGPVGAADVNVAPEPHGGADHMPVSSEAGASPRAEPAGGR